MNIVKFSHCLRKLCDITTYYIRIINANVITDSLDQLQEQFSCNFAKTYVSSVSIAQGIDMLKLAENYDKTL